MRAAAAAISGQLACGGPQPGLRRVPTGSARCQASGGTGQQQEVNAGELTLERFVRSAKAQRWVELNADKSRDCLVNTDSQPWIETAAGGVRRKLIERLGGEVARATTVVEFAPNASFPSHVHEGGEEFLVLEGDWLDDWARQPRHTYVRNYIGSHHTPRMGPNGCTILVKLCQMSHEHKEPTHSQWDFSSENPAWRPCSLVPGRQVLNVYRSPYEEVRFERWAPGAEGFTDVPEGGLETFVLEGSFEDELGQHRAWSWARSASCGQRRLAVGPDGCLLYVKSGHLMSPEVDIHALQPK